MYKGQNGKTYIGFGDQPKLIELDELLPEDLRGMNYEEVKSSKPVGQFFELADLVLISAEAMTAHVKTLDMSGVTKENPMKTRLPAADLDYLRVRDKAGNLLPGPMTAIFSIVAAYWKSKGSMAIEPGLVAGLWRRGMSAEDTIKCIQASTGKNGKLIKDSGRGHDIIHTVIEAYVAVKGLPRDAELPQEEMADLVARWLTATRSAPLKSREAANSVIHWSEYRQLGLIDDTGAAQLDQIRRVAKKLFSINAQLSFQALSAWVNACHPPQVDSLSQSNKTARALLKKKRKQGKLNRRRGQR